MDLNLLRTFLAVYRSGSLTAAAPTLGLSQPTVTTHLRTLERQLGRQLFRRLPRGVGATAAADELARRIAPHVDALATVDGDGRRADPFARSVHLGGPADFLATRAVPALADLVPRGLRLRVATGLTAQLLDDLTAGTLDLVVATVRPRARQLAWTPLTDEDFVLVGAPAWAARLAGTDPATMPRHAPLIAFAEDLPVIRRYWRSVFGRPPAGEAAVVLPDLRGILAATVAGAGVTVLPRYLCRAELATGTLVPLHEPDLAPINTIYLARRAGDGTPDAVLAVHDELIRTLR